MNRPKIVHLRLSVAAVAATWLLAGCGLAETAAVTAAQAEAAAEQAKQGKEMQEKVERDVEAAPRHRPMHAPDRGRERVIYKKGSGPMPAAQGSILREV